MSKNKGKVGEREVTNILKDHGWEARRGQQFQGGTDSPDVVHNIPDTHIEVKRTESLSLYKAMEQARIDSKPHEAPTVWHRRSQQKWLVIMDFEDYLKLIDKSYRNQPDEGTDYDNLEF